MTRRHRGWPQVRVRAVRLLVAAAVVQVGTSVLAPGSGAARVAALVADHGAGRAVPGGQPSARRAYPLIGARAAAQRRGGRRQRRDAGVGRRGGAGPGSLALTCASRATRCASRPVPDTRLAAAGRRRAGRAARAGRRWSAPGDVLVAAGVGLLLRDRAASGRAGGGQTPRRAERSTVLDRESTTVGSYS